MLTALLILALVVMVFVTVGSITFWMDMGFLWMVVCGFDIIKACFEGIGMIIMAISDENS